jgi:ferredoxin
MDTLQGRERILIVGCGTCVAVCLAGGEKEVGLLSSQLAIASELKGMPLTIGEATVERQCDKEFLQELRNKVGDYEVLLSMACGVGVQFLAEMYEEKVVLPGVDTSFIGANDDVGFWTERCRLCNQCYLAVTGAICPVTLCPKGLLNGPCSGMKGGMCEVDSAKPCAWVLIYERLEGVNRLDQIRSICPPQRHRLTTAPAHLVHEAYKRRYSADE